MDQSITAVYENGILRPLTPLELPNNTQVKLHIEQVPDTDDPVLSLIGIFNSDKPLIDNISASEDPELYILAEALGEGAAERHAWEIAPTRYRRGENGKPVRIDSE